MTVLLHLNQNNFLASYGLRHMASYRHLALFLREHHREVNKGKVVPVFHILWGVETLVDYALLKKKKNPHLVRV
jgi:hypothetical protein